MWPCMYTRVGWRLTSTTHAPSHQTSCRVACPCLQSAPHRSNKRESMSMTLLQHSRGPGVVRSQSTRYTRSGGGTWHRVLVSYHSLLTPTTTHQTWQPVSRFAMFPSSRSGDAASLEKHAYAAFAFARISLLVVSSLLPGMQPRDQTMLCQKGTRNCVHSRGRPMQRRSGHQPYMHACTR